ncbi:hypothetical protein [Brevundimonas denitrificans]|uniref:hypothetical protein n=1 Tax=Brevundimonas denitrificans TaxID=1443434 RepID=UPI00223AABA4|nr:hypothetical protein [Brevundimonas denitrificans]
MLRYWGGEPRLLTALERRGVTVVGIEDATDFDGVRANVRRVADALGRQDAGRGLIADMDERLASAPEQGPRARRST